MVVQLPKTIERIIPKYIDKIPYSSAKKILERHIKRYETAAGYVKGKKVLDIACGAGYGSQMLAQAGAELVVGVDVFEDAILYAQEHYQMPQINFVCADAEQFDWPEAFDVIVSYETIEHLHYPQKFLERLRKLLVPGGYLLLSVPLGETRHFDPYHLHAFSEKDIHDLLAQSGFSLNFDNSCINKYFIPRSEILRMAVDSPERSVQPSWIELFFTHRGPLILRDIFLYGGFELPNLFLATQAKN